MPDGMTDKEWSLKVMALNKSLWAWVSRNIDDILEVEMPWTVFMSVGRLGSPSRNHNKPAYADTEFHPAFLRYFNTKRCIRDLHDALVRLHKTNESLKEYIILRGEGYRIDEIDNLDLFDGHRLIDQSPPPSRRGKHPGTSKFGQGINALAISFLYAALPDDVKTSFGSRETFERLFSVAPNQRRPERAERMKCPRCNGTNPECSLCHRRKKPWDGTVARHLYNIYMKRIESGEVWEDS